MQTVMRLEGLSVSTSCHTSCQPPWHRPACSRAPIFAAGRLTRVVPVAALPLAAGRMQRLQQPQVIDEDNSSRKVALLQRPVLDGVPEVEAVPWNKQTERDLFHFWATRDVLVDEVLWDTPAQATEQKALRGKLRRWGAACARHRDVAFLERYMASWDAAAAATSSQVDVSKLVLARRDIISGQLDPGRILHNVELLDSWFAEAGMQYHLFRATTLAMSSSKTLAARLPQVLESLQGFLGADAAAAVVEAQPGILAWGHKQDLGGRIAALQRLHPDFDAATAACRAPQLLRVRPELVTARWHGIQAAARLTDEEMVALANYDPAALGANLEVVQWKLALYHMYDQQRASCQQRGSMAGKPSHERLLQFPSWVTNMIKCSEARFQRLEYLISMGAFDKRAHTIVREPDANFLERHPEFMAYLQWPGPKAAAAQGGSDTSSGVDGTSGEEGVSSAAEQPSMQQADADVQGADKQSKELSRH